MPEVSNRRKNCSGGGRKRIYEALHPEAKATNNGGGFKGNQHVVTDNLSATSYAADASAATGVTERRILRGVSARLDGA